MANTAIKIPRAHLIMALCLPLAVLLGYFLAEPMESGSMAVIVFVIFVLAVPLLMKWHHPILVLSWNAVINPVMLPGQPLIWVPVAAASLVFALLNRAVNPDSRFIYIPSLANPLLFLTAVVILTAWMTGGIGLRSFGSAHYGGRSYVYLFMAIVGYFAFTSQRIAPEKAGIYIAMFFLSSLTGLIPNIVYELGPTFYPLFYFFPVGTAVDQARADYALNQGIFRLNGLPFAGTALFYWILARYGIKGTLELSKPWRLLCLVTAIVCFAASGFRGYVVGFVMTFCALFFADGLHRTRLLPLLLGFSLAGAAILLPNTQKLPWVVQRTISFLPVKIDPLVKQSAESSTEWRLEIWKQVIPQIPKYLFLGKGFRMDPNELYLESTQSNLAITPDAVAITGDYHSGPLSLIIPLGIWGVIGFVWFLVAASRYLYRNYRHGDPQLQRINTFLWALFIVKVFIFCAIFGSFYSDLYTFTGLLGISVSLNGRPEPVAETETAEPEQPMLEAFS
jgi:hypothetical protein